MDRTPSFEETNPDPDSTYGKWKKKQQLFILNTTPQDRKSLIGNESLFSKFDPLIGIDYPIIDATWFEPQNVMIIRDLPHETDILSWTNCVEIGFILGVATSFTLSLGYITRALTLSTLGITLVPILRTTRGISNTIEAWGNPKNHGKILEYYDISKGELYNTRKLKFARFTRALITGNATKSSSEILPTGFVNNWVQNLDKIIENGEKESLERQTKMTQADKIKSKNSKLLKERIITKIRGPNDIFAKTFGRVWINIPSRIQLSRYLPNFLRRSIMWNKMNENRERVIKTYSKPEHINEQIITGRNLLPSKRKKTPGEITVRAKLFLENMSFKHMRGYIDMYIAAKFGKYQIKKSSLNPINRFDLYKFIFKRLTERTFINTYQISFLLKRVLMTNLKEMPFLLVAFKITYESMQKISTDNHIMTNGHKLAAVGMLSWAVFSWFKGNRPFLARFSWKHYPMFFLFWLTTGYFFEIAERAVVGTGHGNPLSIFPSADEIYSVTPDDAFLHPLYFGSYLYSKIRNRLYETPEQYKERKIREEEYRTQLEEDIKLMHPDGSIFKTRGPGVPKRGLDTFYEKIYDIYEPSLRNYETEMTEIRKNYNPDIGAHDGKDNAERAKEFEEGSLYN
eukprot:TRINITY_DN10230_c0_g1_i1.p1 TRINITY_DN10230_c0_g1~~TRINITY_DN10230_c0_g1_i1.p1  ORF type:complete len:627 (-),score=123.89 TRINITY_DN10230_c0_g1_i1:24-1904(-)